MRAIVVTAHGGPDVLTWQERPDLAPRPGQVLVQNKVAGVNFIDTYLRRGLYPSDPPYVPGTEGSGVVAALGDGVTGLSVGDRVAWCDAPGSYAEQVLVNATRAVRVPAEVADEVAGTMLLQGLTADYLLRGAAHPRPGDTVLVHAGAGGVGLILTQLAVAAGLTVISTVSTDEKEVLSREAGAAHVLRYGNDLADRVRGLTGGKGVAVVYDGVGADTFDASIAATAVRGTVVLFGAASGPVPLFDLQRLNTAGSLSVTRPTLAHFIADPDEFAERSGRLVTAVADGTVRIRVGAHYPLADTAQAHRDLESRATTGSIALMA
ncbi:NADPH--quinone reductase [Gordonia araii NBRC 100433]|uniref:NADPH--quinone reductase n=1 Tax=Gordonia araii NBRC 100433 TaxID=1073574 RepID=G7H0N8_9ACTN|nr:quinone oxidoreductase [Gordonia araii]NNG96824.1 quinone oxidoreductase [Gordonia araii NBRC 100433]GAB09413.1 NADPH--quinone reductase [Gordonia araii NBRC 100433]